MIRWSEIAFTKSVAKFKCAALTNVEYALLIAMIFTKPGKILGIFGTSWEVPRIF